MLLLILAYLGGMLTIFSPCVLPVVPFVFARSDQPFRRSGLPMLLGMALSFAFFSVLSVAGGRWIVELNQFGRAFALVVFAVVGLSLLFPNVADRLARPFVRLGGVLQKRADAKTGFGSSLLLGASVGLLWAPCAGPILGLLLAGASLGKSNQQTFALLFVFALGAATSLGVAILAGGKVLKVMKKGLGAEEWIKRFLGVAVLLGVVAIALGLDTKILAKLPTLNTNAIEQSIVQKVSGDSSDEDAGALLNGSEAPELNGATQWLNSSPLTIAALRGKVVLVDFWTYSCINCLRSLPYLKAWSEKYKDAGLIVIGVHAPEFAFEKNITSVKNAVRDLALGYPIAIDNDQKIWSAYQNQYWPAHYFIDAKGIVRHHHFGEGSYEESEKVLRDLLKEANGGKELNVATTKVAAVGIEAASSEVETSPETYLGYERQQGFVSRPDLKQDAAQIYEAPANLRLNQWSISGEWKIGSEVATLNSKQGSLSFRFRARDLHLVISGPEGKSIRYRVSIDGKPPGEAHGLDTDASGNGKVESHRLYQLLRLKENDGEHTFRIEFLDPHAEVFAFTFG